MFDTNVTVVGTALNTPEWRRTTSGALVAHFKVASHSRRYDKDSGRWVDGDSLRVRVTCWRRLAEGVAASVLVGDPVIVRMPSAVPVPSYWVWTYTPTAR